MKKLVEQMPQPRLDAFKQTDEYKKLQAEEERKKERYGSRVPYNKLSEDAQKAREKMLKIRRQEKRKNSIILSETLKTLMQLPAQEDDDVRQLLVARGVDDESITEATIMCYNLIQRGKIDTRSFESTRDTIGQKPIEKQVILENTTNPQDIIRKHFPDL